MVVYNNHTGTTKDEFGLGGPKGPGVTYDEEEGKLKAKSGGALFNIQGKDPVSPDDLVTKRYADSIVGGSGVVITETAAVDDVSTDSSTYVTMPGMTVIPGPGNYLITFSASGGMRSAGRIGKYAIFIDDTIVQHTERLTEHTKKEAFHTQHYASGLWAGEIISVRYLGNTKTLRVHERSLILMKV